MGRSKIMSWRENTDELCDKGQMCMFTVWVWNRAGMFSRHRIISINENSSKKIHKTWHGNKTCARVFLVYQTFISALISKIFKRTNDLRKKRNSLHNYHKIPQTQLALTLVWITCPVLHSLLQSAVAESHCTVDSSSSAPAYSSHLSSKKNLFHDVHNVLLGCLKIIGLVVITYWQDLDNPPNSFLSLFSSCLRRYRKSSNCWRWWLPLALQTNHSSISDLLPHLTTSFLKFRSELIVLPELPACYNTDKVLEIFNTDLSFISSSYISVPVKKPFILFKN